MSKKMTNPGNMPKVWELMVELHKTTPGAFENPQLLRHYAAKKWKSLDDKEKCPNCKASMVSYRFEFDMPNACMLISMSRLVKARLDKGIDFTEANQIHVQSMNTATYAMKSRTTQMAKLGLVAKVLKNGKHVSGYWLITKRGWEALANRPVPQSVESFRNQITERTDKMTTIKEVLHEWSVRKKQTLLRGKKLKTDYSVEVEDYRDHSEWIHKAETQAGLFL